MDIKTFQNVAHRLPAEMHSASARPATTTARPPRRHGHSEASLAQLVCIVCVRGVLCAYLEGVRFSEPGCVLCV